MDDLKKQILFSLEVFPPKDEVALADILKLMPEFTKLNPDYISVTYGAGGGTRTYTSQIASLVQNQYNIKSVAHLTSAGATRESVFNQLQELKQNNISTILALRGDLKEDGMHRLTDFKYATDLIKFIKDFGGFNIYAACYPEGHSESDSYAKDIEVLKIKADLGVSRFISQLFFDNDDYFRMRECMDKMGINVPVQAGIMPLTNVKQILRIVYLSGAKLPTKLTKIVSRFENDPIAFRQAGLNYAVQQITDLIANGAEGIHLYCMNNPKTAEYIASGVKPLLGEV